MPALRRPAGGFLLAALLLAPVPGDAAEASWWPSGLRSLLRGAWRSGAASYSTPLEGQEAVSSLLRRPSGAPPAAPPAAAAAGAESAWAPLRELLGQWRFTENFAVVVGDAQGVRFRYEHGNFSVHTKVGTASTSKWPSAMMLAGLVNDGTIASLDDPVNKYLPWWTKQWWDPRSRVTFRHLLTFTSGFGGGHPGDRDVATAGAQRRARLAGAAQGAASGGSAVAGKGACAMNGDITECARSIYSSVALIGEPGKVYSYNSNHLQLAGAVAVAASGLSIQGVIEKYLVGAYGMSESSYFGSNPDLATALITTGRDYARFMAGVLTHRPLSKAIVDASEQDATPFMSDYYTLYGNYGFGHFLACFDSTAGFTEACRRAGCHLDPGAFGFYPLLDRRLGYYMEVVAFESGPFYPRSGIPEYLGLAVKPLIDAVMSGNSIDATASHHTPGFSSLSLTDVNYIAGCYVDPASCT